VHLLLDVELLVLLVFDVLFEVHVFLVDILLDLVDFADRAQVRHEVDVGHGVFVHFGDLAVRADSRRHVKEIYVPSGLAFVGLDPVYCLLELLVGVYEAFALILNVGDMGDSGWHGRLAVRMAFTHLGADAVHVEAFECVAVRDAFEYGGGVVFDIACFRLHMVGHLLVLPCHERRHIVFVIFRVVRISKVVVFMVLLFLAV